MARTERIYEHADDADKMIKALCEKYPEVLWCVRPEKVTAMGITNQERSEKAVAKKPIHIKLRAVKGAEKAIFGIEGIPTRFIVEFYFADWARWSDKQRQYALMSTLLEIGREDESRNSPDLVGFKIFVDVAGVVWDAEGAELKDLLREDVKFDLALLPGIEEESEEPVEESSD